MKRQSEGDESHPKKLKVKSTTLFYEVDEMLGRFKLSSIHNQASLDDVLQDWQNLAITAFSIGFVSEVMRLLRCISKLKIDLRFEYILEHLQNPSSSYELRRTKQFTTACYSSVQFVLLHAVRHHQDDGKMIKESVFRGCIDRESLQPILKAAVESNNLDAAKSLIDLGASIDLGECNKVSRKVAGALLSLGIPITLDLQKLSVVNDRPKLRNLYVAYAYIQRFSHSMKPAQFFDKLHEFLDELNIEKENYDQISTMISLIKASSYVVPMISRHRDYSAAFEKFSEVKFGYQKFLNIIDRYFSNCKNKDDVSKAVDRMLPTYPSYMQFDTMTKKFKPEKPKHWMKLLEEFHETSSLYKLDFDIMSMEESRHKIHIISISLCGKNKIGKQALHYLDEITEEKSGIIFWY